MNTQLTNLEQEIRASKPDSKKVSALANQLHKQLADMGKMHEGC